MAFLQKLFDSGGTQIKRSHFFETLKSKRRLNMCREVGSLLYELLRKHYSHNDPFSDFSELSGYDIHAGDAHYHGAAVHDVKKFGKNISNSAILFGRFENSCFKALNIGGYKRQPQKRA